MSTLIPRRGVTPDGSETALLTLLVHFANEPAPEDPAAVEARFRAHPFAARSPFWKSLGDSPPDAAIAAFRTDHAQLREDLARIAADDVDWRIAERSHLGMRLTEALSVGLEVGSHEVRLPLGRPVVRVDRRGVHLGFEPFLTGVQATIWYGLALLLDPGRDLARGFSQCGAASAEATCGRFFWRARGERYCSLPCSLRAKRHAGKRRVQAWRKRDGA
jgi:hypothetical protein